jgi:murein L,D-transpeptidase YcbB/YkuD
MPIRRLLAVVLAALALGAAAGQGCFVGGISPPARARDDVAAAIQTAVETGIHPWLRRHELGAYQAAARAVYEGRKWKPIWLDDGEPSSEAKEVITHLNAAAVWGLEPNDYDADRLAWEGERLETKPRPTDAEAGNFDVGLTIAAMRYASDAYLGRIDPRQLGFGLDEPPKPLDLPEVVRDLADDSPNERLDALDPPFPLFGRLVVALAEMRAVAQRKDLPAIPADLPKLREGDRSAAVPDIRRLLTILGDLPESARPPRNPTRYDAVLAAAVRRFQHRHGRSEDAVIGMTTLEDLRVPPQHRVQQIELALERLRWLPAQFAERFIVVNVPEFRLRAFDAGSETPRLTMGVVVGSAAHGTETPVLHAEMRYVIFQPIWTVPDEIARGEILPKLAKDPAYLEKQNMEYDSAGRIRQRPGPNNSLGLVKFILPNPYQVYLHDTPSKELFRRSRRDFSHGCIRVADPVALAEFVLDGAWDRTRIVEAMKEGPQRNRVDLAAPVPVYLLYTTAVVDPDGRISFYDDIYGHDARLARALANRYLGTAL